MPDPFASALDAIFTAPGSEAAEHTSIFGVQTSGVRIIRSRNDQMARLGDAPIITGTHLIEVRKSQLPDLREGDTIIVGQIGEDDIFTPVEELVLTGEPVGDSENLTWTIGAEPVDASR
ncbi:hypothetical protein EBBID32_45380 [Sphingobium indicum BiD32]|uniref:Uncharacterized protein n=1 Tax=Sphingobium indicum BiD32 TaxID=1301087 RepID=N1MXC8_9SPHN|nr:hypothetical protein [Sphingobium indicum]CCW20167.1 hypothetical protein EBBID32_45380 [Sphingobium indicum BiD32]